MDKNVLTAKMPFGIPQEWPTTIFPWVALDFYLKPLYSLSYG